MGLPQLTSYLSNLSVQPPVFVEGSDAFDPQEAVLLKPRSSMYGSVVCLGRPSLSSLSPPLLIL